MDLISEYDPGHLLHSITLGWEGRGQTTSSRLYYVYLFIDRSVHLSPFTAFCSSLQEELTYHRGLVWILQDTTPLSLLIARCKGVHRVFGHPLSVFLFNFKVPPSDQLLHLKRNLPTLTSKGLSSQGSLIVSGRVVSVRF